MKAYKGRDAKFFDECKRSQYVASEQVKIAFTTFNLQTKIDDTMILGTISPNSAVYCNKIFGVTVSENNPISIYVKSLIATTGNYIAKEYLEEPPIFPETYEQMIEQAAAEELDN